MWEDVITVTVEVELVVAEIVQTLISKPYLEPAPLETYTFEEGETVSIELGEAIDPLEREEEVSVEVKFAEAALFMHLSNNEIKLDWDMYLASVSNANATSKSYVITVEVSLVVQGVELIQKYPVTITIAPKETESAQQSETQAVE